MNSRFAAFTPFTFADVLIGRLPCEPIAPICPAVSAWLASVADAMLSAGCVTFVPSQTTRAAPAGIATPVPEAVFAVIVNAPVVLFTIVHSRVHAGRMIWTFPVSDPVSTMRDFIACAGVNVTFTFVRPEIAEKP
ncbi:hypothetical protein AQ709_05395 [Burkholderia pseudomallei]|nr:hypothetical protein AQ709_05395 [Burkholderia pseudomallei]OMQ74426.1 hypothetical protein AQ711_23150 [Burkholderia pseudomallei]OMQ77296.1 hypothetical protein AQ712_02565 [Burkholderia pseudomallei]